MTEHRSDRKGPAAAARRAAIAGLLLAAVAGCGSSELHDRYTAERLYWKATHRAARLNLGQQVVSHEEIQQAASAFAAITRSFPPGTWAGRSSRDARVIALIGGESLYRQAELLAADKRYDDARRLLDEVDREFPDEQLAVLSAYERAVMFRAEEKPEEAAAVMATLPSRHRAVQADGQNAESGVMEAPLLAARWYADLDKMDKAREVLGDAVTLYQRVAAEHPGTDAATVARIHLYAARHSRGDWPEAIEAMRQLLADPRFVAEDKDGGMTAFGRMSIAEISAFQLGRTDEALREARKVIDGGGLKEFVAGALIVEARILSGAGRAQEAVADLDRACREAPASPEIAAQASYTRGQVYEAAGDWERALAEYRDLITKYPRTELGLAAPLQIVERYDRVGDKEASAAAFERALVDYRRVIDLDPRSQAAVTARRNMAAGYQMRGDWEKAAAAWGDVAQAAQQGNAGAEALWREAEIYRDQLHNPAEAESRLRQLVSSYPTTDAAKRAAARLSEMGRRPAP